MKKRIEKKGGFTLVELIVVLVILAILAAVAVPALLGYIDKSKDKKIIINAQSAYMAAQTLARQAYSDMEPNPNEDDVKDMAEVPGTVSPMTIAEGKVQEPFKYTENGRTATLSGGTWTVGVN